MNQSILSIYNVVSIPGRREFYPHKHNEFEIAYFRSGYGTYSVTGHDYPIEPGDIFIYSNNEIHKITYVDPSYEMSALNLHFSPLILLSQSNLSEADDRSPDLTRLFFDRSKPYSNRITREIAGSSYDKIVACLLAAEEEYNSGLVGGCLLARQHLISSLVYILRGCDLVTEQSSLGAKNGQIAAALEYIDSCFSSDVAYPSCVKSRIWVVRTSSGCSANTSASRPANISSDGASTTRFSCCALPTKPSSTSRSSRAITTPRISTNNSRL